jgi:hypothetical protein
MAALIAEAAPTSAQSGLARKDTCWVREWVAHRLRFERLLTSLARHAGPDSPDAAEEEPDSGR